jgi:hypothetical protein
MLSGPAVPGRVRGGSLRTDQLIPQGLADRISDGVGYKDIKMGMPLGALVKTGEATPRHTDAAPGCSWFNLSQGGTAVYSAHRGGVVAIIFNDDMATTKGVRVGSSQARVRDAYPLDSVDGNGYVTVPITSDIHYTIAMSATGTVGEVLLESDHQDCYG